MCALKRYDFMNGRIIPQLKLLVVNQIINISLLSCNRQAIAAHLTQRSRKRLIAAINGTKTKTIAGSVAEHIIQGPRLSPSYLSLPIRPAGARRKARRRWNLLRAALRCGMFLKKFQKNSVSKLLHK